MVRAVTPAAPTEEADASQQRKVDSRECLVGCSGRVAHGNRGSQREWESTAPQDQFLTETSLLNLMAHRMTSGGRMKMEGKIEFNGGPLKDIQHSYVIQEDILLCTPQVSGILTVAALTVRETLKYAAALRLAGATRKQRNDLVEQVILQLGLKDAAGTLVGDDMRRGCSGGEKRRTSIGVQLLANPSVLFLGKYVH